MIPFDRFTVVLDACTLFPMLVRDALLTLAGHEFFNPKWSARIRAEWMRNLSEKLMACEREQSADVHADDHGSSISPGRILRDITSS
jgi:hypothetical protein